MKKLFKAWTQMRSYQPMLLGFKPIRRLLAAFLIAALGFTETAMAEEVANLYQDTIIVESQSQRELDAAAKSGLAQVFIRVSGSADAAQQPAIRSALRRAKSFVKQFRYQTFPATDTEEEQLSVVLSFQKTLVDNQLREAELPLWSSNRPNVLVWLAVDDVQGRGIADAESYPMIIEQLIASSRARGLPVKTPLLDLEDSIVMTADRLWEMNMASVLAASSRYNPDTLLIGRVTVLSNGQWLGNWQYQYGDKQINFDGQADSMQAYIQFAVDKVADSLAQSYAIAPVKMSQDGIILRLSQVGSFKDYARAIRYLEGLEAIRSANVFEVGDDAMLIRLRADGELSQLKKALALDNRMVPIDDVIVGEVAAQLNYSWLQGQ